MKISHKQARIGQTIKDRQAQQIFLIGALGTSKTFGAAVAMLSVALKFPDSLILVGRKNRTELKRGTLLSFREAAEEMHLYENIDIKENDQDLTWTIPIEQPDGTYKHSYIMFLELDHTKDRQFTKVKSINATCAMIDEADGVVHDAHIALYSRTGRRNKNGAPRFILDTCNPNEAWIKTEVYDKWSNPEEHGPLPEDMAVIEFETADSFLGAAYYDGFKNMPAPWRKRYLKNDWNYGDDDTSLFKYRHMDRQHVKTYSPALRYVGYDVARTGRDRSVLAMWEGRTLVDIKIIKDHDEQMDTADQADELHTYATENLVGHDNISVDAVGIGVGVIDSAHKLNMWVHEFMSGAASTETVRVKNKDGEYVDMPLYDNKRSEIAHKLSRDLEAGEAFFHDGCPFLAEFKKEATMHNYASKDRQLGLEPKDKVKERLGHSPDLFDAVLMGYERVLNATSGANAILETGGDYEHLYNQGNGSIMDV